MKIFFTLEIIVAAILVWNISHAPRQAQYGEGSRKSIARQLPLADVIPETWTVPTFVAAGKIIPREKTEPNMLQIPDLALRAPIVFVSEVSEKVFQEGLARGVVHFPGTALPGRPGNAYIFGHSSDYRWSKGSYKTVFAPLPGIKPGALIHISDPEGNKFIYQVQKTKVVGSNDVQFLNQGKFAKKILTLQTSYPVGTARQRFLVIAEIRE